jgi:hypothetical protein
MTLFCLILASSLPVWAFALAVVALFALWVARNKTQLAFKLFKATRWSWPLFFVPVGGGTVGPNETISSTARLSNIEAVSFLGGNSSGPALAQGAFALSPVSVYTAAGAITIPPGSFNVPETGAVSSAVDISGSSVLAMTLAAPASGPTSAGGQDGTLLVIFNDTAAKAHTITTSANIINGNQSIITMSSTSSTLSSIVLMAYSGIWWVLANTNCTLSGT